MPAALLVVGPTIVSAGPGSTLDALQGAARLGPALLACRAGWSVARLAPDGSPQRAPHRLNVCAALDSLDGPGSLVLVDALFVNREDGPHVVLDARFEQHPVDACVGFAEILAAAPRPALVMLDGLATLPADFVLPPDVAVVTHRRGERGWAARRLADWLKDPPRPATLADVAAAFAEPPFELAGEPGDAVWMAPVAHPDSAPEREPVQFGDYTLFEVLGRGSFGVVYRAVHGLIERPAAVKMLSDERADAETRFLGELKGLAAIEHRNVVQVINAGVHDGQHFIVTELVDGETLRARLERGRLSVESVLDLACQLLEALVAVHTARFVHGDVKPDNISLVDEPQGVRLVLLDFGAALHCPEEFVRMRGGTPAYMPPEQRGGRVGLSADVYAAAATIVEMARGERPQAPGDLDGLGPQLAAALAPALAIPTARRPTAAALLATLRKLQAARRADFHLLGPCTDSRSLCGRDADLEHLVSQVIFEDFVGLTSPFGMGKSSLLRAGLMPSLQRLDMDAALIPLRTDPRPALINAIHEGSNSVATALAAASPRCRWTFVLDQFESVFSPETISPDDGYEILADVRRLLADKRVSLLIAVREDFLARLFEADLVPVMVRLPPLDRDAAEQALIGPFDVRGVELDSGTLARALDDLVAAGAELGQRRGWDRQGAVYPPHIQLLGAALASRVHTGTERLDDADYEAIGGLSGALGDHLERTLNSALMGPAVAAARDLFKSLATAQGTRAIRGESELYAELCATRGHAETDVRQALQVLADHRLLQPVRDGEETAWELVHDELIPRIERWLDQRELEARKTKEMLRLRVHRSRPSSPDLLNRKELAEVSQFPQVVEELAREGVVQAGGGLPADLVAHSRRFHARRRLLGLCLALGVALIVAGGAWVWLDEQENKTQNIGQLDLRIRLMDGDTPVDPSQHPNLSVRLLRDAEPFGHEPGPPVEGQDVRPLGPGEFRIAAKGDAWLLEVDGRGLDGAQCPPSWISRFKMPGYVEGLTKMTLSVPSCAMSARDLVEVPAGPFWGGTPEDHKELVLRRFHLSAFAIDRFELSEADVTRHRRGLGLDPRTHARASNPNEGLPDHPATNLSWREARDVCWWQGKRLPTLAEAQKAGRGPDDETNPRPQRRYPWGHDAASDVSPPGDGRLAVWFDEGARERGLTPAPAPVKSGASGASFYGVHHLTGNVAEWRADGYTRPMWAAAPQVDPRGTLEKRGHHGGHWHIRVEDLLWVGFAAFIAPDQKRANLGARCARSLP